MYRIVIGQKGKPAERRTSTTSDELRDAAYDLIRAQGSTVADEDHAGVTQLVAAAQAMADDEGFAALEFGSGWITIRPQGEETPRDVGLDDRRWDCRNDDTE